MCMAHNALAINARRRDPTQTTVLRGKYAAEAAHRFMIVKSLIRQTIVDNDALTLSDRRDLPLIHADRRNITGNVEPAQRYDFPSDPAGKAQAFLDWLQGAVDEHILDVTRGERREIVSYGGWQDVYVRGAYARGVNQASAALKGAGMAIPAYSMAGVLNAPMHADPLAMLIARNFNDLKGVTDAMSQQIARALADGLGAGLGPQDIAWIITDRVDRIGIVRARMMARTEIIHVHAESTLNRYQEFAVPGVSAEAELSTSGDGDVCDKCRGLEGNIYTIQEARGMIPVHPNCRCAWKPAVRRLIYQSW